MLQTLVGVIVGGTLTILSQLMVGVLQAKEQRRKERSTAIAILRVQQFHFYAAQHLLKESLETGRWWTRELVSFSLPTDHELTALTMLLPIHAWRSYTAAVRRLTGCAHLRETAGNGAEPIDTAMLQRLMGTFVTLDYARRTLGPVSGVSANEVGLGTVALSPGQIDEALRLYASNQVPLEEWSSRRASTQSRQARG
ncbi:hypothetical protein ACRYCC_34295 [Actinomadura scrupuli]|uniref:hypothetical protein n=1 Tax=Actinomadura scrupuli TaxID=559629 RepID=UPI003D97B786